MDTHSATNKTTVDVCRDDQVLASEESAQIICLPQSTVLRYPTAGTSSAAGLGHLTTTDIIVAKIDQALKDNAYIIAVIKAERLAVQARSLTVLEMEKLTTAFNNFKISMKEIKGEISSYTDAQDDALKLLADEDYESRQAKRRKIDNPQDPLQDPLQDNSTKR